MNEFEHDYTLPDEKDPLIEWLLEGIRKRAPKIQTIDRMRFADILFCRDALVKLLQHAGENSEIELKYHPLLSAASLSVEILTMDVYKKDLFFEAVRFADTFSFEPLTNGNIRFSMTFANTLKPI